MRALGFSLALAVLASCRPTPPPPPAPSPDALPVFTTVRDPFFVDQDGQPFNAARLHGRVWIANFIFTTCQMACPILSARMGNLQTRLKDDGPAIQLLSFSILPDTDTPPVLKAYGEKFHRDPNRWTLVTGPVDSVLGMVSDGFTTAAARNPSLLVSRDSNFSGQHGEMFVLLDQSGRVRGYYRKDDASLDRLLKDARQLATQPS